MIRRIFLLFCALALAGIVLAQGPNDPDEGLRVSRDSSTGIFTLSWWGRSSRNYFLQQADDLSSGWTYLPLMDSGANQILQWSLTSSAPKGFFRLQFDNDLNGLPDAWELANYGPNYSQLHLTANGLAPRGDGLSNLQTLYQGLNPLSAYNVTQPGTGQNVPVISLNSSATTGLTAPASVTLTATASETGGTIARVDFYQDGSYLGSSWTGSYQWSPSKLPAGNYQFSAVAVDAAGFSTPSNTVMVAVAPPVTVAASTRYSRGNGTDPTYLSFVVATDFEKGAQLDPTWTGYSLGGVHNYYGTTSNVTVTAASPCVVTWNSHGLPANTPVMFFTTGALPTGLTAGTVYYVSATGLSANSFQISATPGGASINTSGTQSGTQIANADINTPWFRRIQRSTAYQISSNGSTLSYPVQFENPVAAFGAEGGGSSLYTGQSYSFGIGSGGQYLANSSLQDFLLEVYDKTTLSNGQTGVAPVQSIPVNLPRPNTSAWTTFAQNGYVQEQIVTSNGSNLFKVAVQYVAGGVINANGTLTFSGNNGSDQWGQYLPSPLLVTVTSYTSAYYLKLSYMGVTINKSQTSSSEYWMAISNPNDSTTGTYSISMTMDFQDRPPWRSIVVDQPQFQGIPLPSAYQGKTLEELLHLAQPIVDTLSAPVPGTYLDLDTSPELRQHPMLDSFVASMGSSNDRTAWAMALTNYVLNEIDLTDAISYSDTGGISDQSINPGGVNRGALATFLERQGSPAEQCSLLVYLLRTAGIQCSYVFPHTSDATLMLDEQLSKLLRMQLKGAVNDLGVSNVPHLIPTNYPWVVAYIDNKWVHIFPWLKDTAVEEGQDLYQYLPDGYQTGRQWLKQYLIDDSNIRSLSTEYDNPGVLFPLFVKNSLKNNFGSSVSIDQIGVNIFNRRNYFTNWSDMPRPWQTPVIAASDLVDNLTAIPNIFDTITVSIFSDQNNNGQQDSGEPSIATGTLRMVDLHNRRLLIYAVQTGPNTHTLNLSLEAFRPNTQGNLPGNFSSTDSLLNSQLKPLSLTSADDNLIVTIDYKRHQSLGSSFTIPDHWAPFLGLNDTLEVKDSRPLRKGDMAALVFNYGRVTSAMLNVQAQKYQSAQQQSINNPNQTVDPEIAQGLPVFMMGMSYYYNVSQTQQQILGLTKSNIVSSFAHGFAKLSPLRNNDATGTLINNGQISLVYPKLDMAFQRLAWANNGTLHPDSGEEEFPPLTDWSPILIGEVSAQEHRTINQFFQQSAAISTVKLLDLTQSGWRSRPARFSSTGGVTVNSNLLTSLLSIGVGKTIFSDDLAGGSATVISQTSASGPHGVILYTCTLSSTWSTTGNAAYDIGTDITVSSGNTLSGQSLPMGTIVYSPDLPGGHATVTSVVSGPLGTYNNILSANWSHPGSTAYFLGTLRAGQSPVIITKDNCDISNSSSPWNTSISMPVGGLWVMKTLKEWAGYPNVGSIYDKIQNGINGVGGFGAWDANYQTVLITPGPIIGANGAYEGLGAFVTGVSAEAAYISDNMNVQNGGFGMANYQSVDATAVSLANWGLQQTPDLSYSFVNPSNQVGGTSVAFTPASFAYQNPASGLDQISSGSVVITDPVTTQSYNLASASLYPTGGAPSILGGGADATIVQSIANAGDVTQTSDYRSLFGTGGKAVMDPVNTVTGEFYVDALDLRLNGPMPLDIRRNYGSQNLADGNFGYGWKLAYVPYLVLSQDSGQTLIYATEMDGSVIAYHRQAAPNNSRWIPQASDNPQLGNMAGDAAGSVTNVFNNHIDKSTVGTDTYYTLTGADGSVRTFKVHSYITPATPGKNDGLTRARPYLQKWQDNRGNFYTFKFYGDDLGEDYTTPGFGSLKQITSSNGSFLGFNDDVYGHVIEAFTSDGRRLSYTYDTYGDLVQVTLPDASTVSYQYSHKPTTSGPVGFYSEHLLIEEDKPQGRVVANVYDNATSRRVVQQQATVGANYALVTNATFAYLDPNGNPRTDTPNSSISGSTTITDVNQHITTYAYTNGLITQITDPLNQTVVQNWYSDDTSPGYRRSLKNRTDRRGLLTEFTYDAAGNVKTKKLTGDLVGDGNLGTTATTTLFYNGLNLVTEIDDPLFKTLYTYGDTVHQYSPTSIEKQTAGGTSISITQMHYSDVSNGTVSAFGLMDTLTQAAGTSDQAVTSFVYNANGFPTQTTRPTGTSDPPVVMSYGYNMRGELISETDALSRSTKYAYDGRGNRTWTERRDETGALVWWDYEYFNQNGEIEWSDGPRYNPEDYVLRQYDGAGRLSQEIKWRSQAISDGSGVQAVTGLDAAYATTLNVHDSFGNLIEIHNPNQNTTLLGYDWIGQMTSRAVYSGYVTTGNTGSLTPLTTEGFQYEPGGLVKQYTNPLNGVTKKYYTSTGQLKRQENPDNSVREWRYDLAGRVVTETLNSGPTWTTAYHDDLRTVAKTYQSGSSQTSETTSFDRRGNVISKLDSENHLFTTTYDALNRVKTTAGPGTTTSAPESVTHTYGAADKVHIVVDALGQKTFTVADALGRPTSVQVMDKKNNIVRETSYVYSADQNSVTEIDGVGATAISTTTFTDTFGKPVLVQHSNNTGTVVAYKLFAYDSNGNLVSSIDENQAVTVNTYDALNRLYTQTLPGGATTTFIYDNAGNVLQRQMPDGQTLWQTFNNASQKTGEHLAGSQPDGKGGTVSGTTRSFTYTYYPDAAVAGSTAWAGLPETTTDPRTVTLTTTYDDFLRPKTVTAAGPLVQQNQTTTYGYDTLNRLTSVAQNYANPNTGPPTLVSRNYDAYGHIATETVSINGAVQNQFNQTWDGAGDRATLASTLAPQGSGAGLSNNYSYWPDGLLRQETVAGNSFNFNYDSNRLLTSRQNAWRTQTITQRDGFGRILTESDTVGANNPLSETQSWMSRGQRLSYTANRTGSGVWNEARNYSYTGRGQLVYESDAPSPGGYADFVYRFDFEGLAATPTGAGLGVRTIALRENVQNDPNTEVGSWFNNDPAVFDGTTARGVDAFERPTSEVQFPAAANTGYSTSWSYDSLGEATSRTYWTVGSSPQARQQNLTWDAFGRLVQVQDGDNSWNGYLWTAIYDGLGRRLRTTQQNDNNGTTSGSVLTLDSFYDPQVEFLELGVAVNGTRTWKVMGPDLNGRYGALQGVGGLEATIDETSGTVTPVVNDAFGNVVGKVSSGTLAWNSARVGSYGVLPGSTAPVVDGSSVTLAQATLWRSQRVDPTGLYYLGARYYDPLSSRFVSPDPLGHGASMDLYSYCDGDPVNGLDPDGRFGKTAASTYIQAQYGVYLDFNQPLGEQLSGNASAAWDGLTGGAAIAANNLTFHQIGGLNDYAGSLDGWAYTGSRYLSGAGTAGLTLAGGIEIGGAAVAWGRAGILSGVNAYRAYALTGSLAYAAGTPAGQNFLNFGGEALDMGATWSMGSPVGPSSLGGNITTGVVANAERIELGNGISIAADNTTLARQVANAAEQYPMQWKRTISIVDTVEGPKVVGGGATDLDAAQVAMAQSLGLTVAPPMPGVHAEPTVILGARSLGLTPTNGVSTNIICPQCAQDIPALGGTVTGKRTFEMKNE